MDTIVIEALRKNFGDQVQENMPLAPFTSARIGGPADVILTVRSSADLADAVSWSWQHNVPFTLLGGGSNVLISDLGIRGLVIMNKAKTTEFRQGNEPVAWAESGTLFSNFAHRCAANGFSGLEWAATIPGTVGGAVYGNAGAFGGDMAHSLLRADMLTPQGREWWPVERMDYSYRSSALKNGSRKGVVLAAEFHLNAGDAESIKATIEGFTSRRKASQPAGASMGSMFRNPAGDYAGRLIEAAGLKGTRIGNAEISTVHANFFINHGQTAAADVKALVELAQKTVKEHSGIDLVLEVEMIGDWSG